MPKVTIVKPKRKAAKDHSKMIPMHKPAGKAKPAKANVKKPTVAK
jgi:hypothetical protein